MSAPKGKSRKSRRGKSETSRLCNSCAKRKPIEKFPWRNSNSESLARLSRCKACIAEYQRSTRAKRFAKVNPENHHDGWVYLFEEIGVKGCPAGDCLKVGFTSYADPRERFQNRVEGTLYRWDTENPRMINLYGAIRAFRSEECKLKRELKAAGYKIVGEWFLRFEKNTPEYTEQLEIFRKCLSRHDEPDSRFQPPPDEKPYEPATKSAGHKKRTRARANTKQNTGEAASPAEVVPVGKRKKRPARESAQTGERQLRLFD